jgi:transcriptional regulator with XRE-family HTH domain
MAAPQTREEQMAFVRRALALTGWSQTVLAKRAGLDPSTLSHFLSQDRDGHALRASTIARIAEVTGLLVEPEPEDSLDVFLEEAVPVSNQPDAVIRELLARLREKHQSVDAWTLRTRALELAGYLPGDILFVSLKETPLAGDVVCGQIYDWAAKRAMTVFRLFHPPFLVASSADPLLMKPTALEGDQVSVKGVVIGSYRPRPATRPATRPI